MKRLIAVLGLSLASVAWAGSYSFSPVPSNLYDLDHYRAYSWGIVVDAASADANSRGLAVDLGLGLQISKAKLTISNIYDWTVEDDDHLFINLLDNPLAGVQVIKDGQPGVSDYFHSGYFTGTKTRLADWSDEYGSVPRGFDLIVDFSADQIAKLTEYIGSYNASDKADFGFGFDPDCHYFNRGITFTVETNRASVPDAGATLVLLGLGLSAVVALRRIVRF